MIARTQACLQPEGWQRELAEGYRLPAELLADLGLTAADIDVDLDPRNPFPMRVPASYARRIRRHDPHDPLLRQVLPLRDERALAPPDYTRDPVGDLHAELTPGVLHKYHGRALLITTGACAVHCRYCFRRHFPYAESAAGTDAWQPALTALAEDGTLQEVILSGGDPLALGSRRLGELIGGLTALPHLRRLRLHTRLPVVLPTRIDDALLGQLSATKLKTVMVIHANHANEIDGEVKEALARLHAAGVTLFNQSVLLRGVNDDTATLVALSEALFDAGVTPYYLHLLDRVAGAAHFEVPAERARELHREMQAMLPGYLVPRLVREEAGAPAKTLLI